MPGAYLWEASRRDRPQMPFDVQDKRLARPLFKIRSRRQGVHCRPMHFFQRWCGHNAASTGLRSRSAATANSAYSIQGDNEHGGVVLDNRASISTWSPLKQTILVSGAWIRNSVRPGNAGRRGVKRRYLHETSSVVQRV